MKPHKHADLIHAWADGAEIQYKSGDGEWYDFTEGLAPSWFEEDEYRIKPEPKPDVVKHCYANELADRLNNSNTNGNLCDEAATMLRQQEAQIEALKAENEKLFTTMLDMALDEELRTLKRKQNE